MEPVLDLADTHDLILMEDSAQGLGSAFKGRMSGTFGLTGVFSFYPAKTLGALGDAGALITDDDDVAAHRALANPTRLAAARRAANRCYRDGRVARLEVTLLPCAGTLPFAVAAFGPRRQRITPR